MRLQVVLRGMVAVRIGKVEGIVEGRLGYDVVSRLGAYSNNIVDGIDGREIRRRQG